MPTAAPVPAPATAVLVPESAPPLATAPAPAPLSPPLARIVDRVFRELEREGGVRMPGRTQGKARLLQYFHRSMGLISMSKCAWLAYQMADREVMDKTIRAHDCRGPNSTSQLPTPAIYQQRQQSPRWKYRSTQKLGVASGYASSAGYCRLNLSRQRGSL